MKIIFFRSGEQKIYRMWHIICSLFLIFLDVFNELLLIAPLLVIGIIILLVWNRKIFIQKNIELKFLVILSGIYILCLAGFNLQKGASRDWDIFSILAIPVTILVMKSIYTVRTSLSRREITFFLLLLSLHSLFRIGVNANEGSALKRIEIIAADEKWSPEARADLYDELRSYYEPIDSEKAYIFSEKTAQSLPSARYLFNWATMAMITSRPDVAIRIFPKVLEIDPNFKEAYLNYGTML